MQTPTHQQVSTHHGNQKLLARYFSTFQIQDTTGVVAYKRRLPPDIEIHNAFHVSLDQSMHQYTLLQPFHAQSHLQIPPTCYT